MLLPNKLTNFSFAITTIRLIPFSKSFVFLYWETLHLAFYSSLFFGPLFFLSRLDPLAVQGGFLSSGDLEILFSYLNLRSSKTPFISFSFI